MEVHKNILAVLLMLFVCFSSRADEWRIRPGRAKDIAIGANGAVWAIGATPTGGGFTIQRWTGSAWQQIDGGGVRIAVDPAGAPWVVNDAGMIWRREGSRWIEVAGARARDIGIGADGSVWIISQSAVSGGFAIQRYISANRWETIPGGGVRISVSPSGRPWIVNDRDRIFQLLPDRSWKEYRGAGKDIAVGASGAVWVIGAIRRGPSDFSVHFRNGEEWGEVDGGGTQIAVETSGRPWLVNSAGEIYQRVYTPNRLSASPTVTPVTMNFPMNGRIAAIAVNPANPNQVLVAGESGGVFECNNFLSSTRTWTHHSNFGQHNVTSLLWTATVGVWATTMNTYDNQATPLIWQRVPGGNWQPATFTASTRLRSNEIDAYKIVKSKVNNDLYAIGGFGVAYKPATSSEWQVVCDNRFGLVSIETMSNGSLIGLGTNGIFRSSAESKGRSWTPVMVIPGSWTLPVIQTHSLATDQNGDVAVACRKIDQFKTLQLYATADTGYTWQNFATPCSGNILDRGGNEVSAGGYLNTTLFYNNMSRQLEIYLSNELKAFYGYAPGINAVAALRAAITNTAFGWLPNPSGYTAGHDDIRQCVIVPSSAGRKIILTSDGGLHHADMNNSALERLNWVTEGTNSGLNALQLFGLTGNGRDFIIGTMDNSFGYTNALDLSTWEIGGGNEGWVVNRRGLWPFEYSPQTIVWSETPGLVPYSTGFRLYEGCRFEGSSLFNSPSGSGWGSPIWLGGGIFIHDARPAAGQVTFPWKISKDNGCSWLDLPAAQYVRVGGPGDGFSTALQPAHVGENVYHSIWLTVGMRKGNPPNDTLIIGRLENPGGRSSMPIATWQYPFMLGLRGGIALVGSQFLFRPVFAVNPNDPQHLLAVEKSTGYLKMSRNGGHNWVEAGDFRSVYERTGGQFFSNRGSFAIWSVAFSPFDPDVALVGTVSKGIFASTDGGNTWRQLPHSGVFMPVSYFWRTPQEVIVATYGRGLFIVRL